MTHKSASHRYKSLFKVAVAALVVAGIGALVREGLRTPLDHAEARFAITRIAELETATLVEEPLRVDAAEEARGDLGIWGKVYRADRIVYMFRPADGFSQVDVLRELRQRVLDDGWEFEQDVPEQYNQDASGGLAFLTKPRIADSANPKSEYFAYAYSVDSPKGSPLVRFGITSTEER